MADSTATVEWSVAKALYAVEWEAVSENLRGDGFANESEESQAYWLKSARAAIAAYKEAVK